MTFRDLIMSSRQSLTRTKGRSAMTMLGIVIGILSVILMLSIGEAAQRYILSQISSFGSDVLVIGNGSKEASGQPTLFIKESLTFNDLKRLQLEPWISLATGGTAQSDELTANGFTTTIQLSGTTPEAIVLSGTRVQYGFFFAPSSVEAHTREAVLGYDVADKTFGVDQAVGQTVKISGQTYKVVGVMEKAGTKSFQNVDKQVYLPVTSALDLYNKKYLSSISVKTTLSLTEAKARLEDFFRERHKIDNPNRDLSKDDFNVTTQEDAVRSASTITNILQILLISIAAISLIVGGIGIINIMYVSVTERIKEIGLRKAIGARRGDILGQFLVEAVLLTTIGGVIGIILGTGLSWLAIQIISQLQGGWTFAVSTNGIVLGLVVSAAIGIVFGYFPARRAAGLHPIDALRAE